MASSNGVIMKNQILTLEQFIEYRNKLVTRREARHKNFPEKTTYYDLRLKKLDKQFPQFKGIGKIYKKGV